jgi:CRISPR/Cas system CSM-associated protein Csm3 (group 7 of RAMP superfamily)
MTDHARIHVALARVTIEFVTGFSIGTGRGDDLYDRISVLDANGIPALPGTSLAGVLRAAWMDAHGEAGSTKKASTDSVFGFQRRSKGQASRLRVSWAHAHTALDKPVSSHLLASAPDDPVLNALKAGALRDHVRIGPHGAVDDRGKFDNLIVPAGARFTFELVVGAGESHEPHADPKDTMDRLLALLQGGQLALGGRSRSGLGRFKVVRTRGRVFDLRQAKDRDVWLALPRDLALDHGLPEWPTANLSLRRRSILDLSVVLRPEDGWLFGTGEANRGGFHLKDKAGKEKPADKVPVTEARIVWSAGRGAVEAKDRSALLIAGSGVKGALRHRTLYHLHRIQERYSVADLDEVPAPLHVLFGHIKEARPDDRSSDAEKQTAGPGRLFIPDVYVDNAKPLPLMHVSLDRFTMGPMDGLLFSEVVATGGDIELTIQLEAPEKRSRDDWSVAAQALHAALADLVEGRLALGSGSSRGHGYFTGKVKNQADWDKLAGGAA